jgi:hypothetical protein
MGSDQWQGDNIQGQRISTQTKERATALGMYQAVLEILQVEGAEQQRRRY